MRSSFSCIFCEDEFGFSRGVQPRADVVVPSSCQSCVEVEGIVRGNATPGTERVSTTTSEFLLLSPACIPQLPVFCEWRKPLLITVSLNNAPCPCIPPSSCPSQLYPTQCCTYTRFTPFPLTSSLEIVYTSPPSPHLQKQEAGPLITPSLTHKNFTSAFLLGVVIVPSAERPVLKCQGGREKKVRLSSALPP